MIKIQQMVSKMPKQDWSTLQQDLELVAEAAKQARGMLDTHLDWDTAALQLHCRLALERLERACQIIDPYVDRVQS